MPTIHANGLDIAYERLGEGPPLLLLHGATGSGRDHFAPILPSLAARFTVFAPDARSHAGTRWDVANGWSAEDLVDDAEAFADALGLSTFHLLGFSMGGMTALQLAARSPGRIRSLVAMSIAPEREPRLSVGRRLMDVDRIERDDPAWAARLAARHDPGQGPGAWRRLLPRIVEDIVAQPLLEPRALRAINAPTLVIAGDRDPFTPVDQAAGLARQVGDGRLLIVPAAGHDPMTDGTAVVLAALDDYHRSTAAVAQARAAVWITPAREDAR